MNSNKQKKQNLNKQTSKKLAYRQKINRWIIWLIILIALTVALFFFNDFRKKIETQQHFGEQPIMDTNLLGLRLKYQVFLPRNPHSDRGGKPSKYLMSNCFYMPNNKTNLELINEVKMKAEEYGWSFDEDWLRKYHSNNELYIISYVRDGFVMSSDVLTPSDNSNSKICINIADDQAW